MKTFEKQQSAILFAKRLIEQELEKLKGTNVYSKQELDLMDIIESLLDASEALKRLRDLYDWMCE